MASTETRIISIQDFSVRISKSPWADINIVAPNFKSQPQHVLYYPFSPPQIRQSPFQPEFRHTSFPPSSIRRHVSRPDQHHRSDHP
jgi:hypothetical protein